MNFYQTFERVLFKRCLGIHIFKTGDNLCVTGVVLKIKKNLEFELEQCLLDLESISAFCRLNKSVPVVFGVNSDAIVTGRYIHEIDDESAVAILGSEVGFDFQNEFAFGYIDDFYGFARKSHLDELTSLIEVSKEQIVGVNFSLIYELNFAKLLNQHYNQKVVPLGDFQFLFESDRISEFPNETKEALEIPDITILYESVSAFCSAIYFLYPKGRLIGLFSETEQRSELFYSVATIKLRWPLLGLLLGLFLLSSVWFVVIDGENQILRDKSVTLQQINEKKNELKQYVSNYSEILGESNAQAELAMFLDQIGYTIPNQLQLSKVWINPKEERNRKVDQSNIVLIEGNLDDVRYLSAWVNELEKKQFILKVIEQKFWINQQNLGCFQIKIERNVE